MESKELNETLQTLIASLNELNQNIEVMNDAIVDAKSHIHSTARELGNKIHKLEVEIYKLRESS